MPMVTTMNTVSSSPALGNQQQGSLYKTLQKLIVNQASGKLIIHNPQEPSLRWRLYLGNGRIHFAGSEVGQMERLNYLLHRYVPEKRFTLTENLEDDYQYLCELWQSGEFSFQQIRSVLAKFTQEALIHVLSLRQVLCHFENTVGLEHLLLYLNLKQIMQPVERQVKQWFHLHPVIPSPFQRPVIAQEAGFRESMQRLSTLSQMSEEHLNLLQGLLEKQLCFYDLARQLKTSTLNVALTLQPLIQSQTINLLPYRLPTTEYRPLIACVDDSPAIQRVVKFTLEASGFQVVGIREPFKALTTLLHAKPSLILMDINMPEVDGYELCSLCHKSAALKDIPIIMLTGRSGILDRMKAHMVGAVDYMCKPFLPEDLVRMVKTHVLNPSISTNQE